jgi:hypothetical protein
VDSRGGEREVGACHRWQAEGAEMVTDLQIKEEALPIGLCGRL